MGTSASAADRRHETGADEVSPVRLTRKLAEAIDGIDLSRQDVGDRVPLSPRDACTLMAEGWAEPVRPEERRSTDLMCRGAGRWR